MSQRPSDDEALADLTERLDALERRRVRKVTKPAEAMTGGAYRLIGELIGGVLTGLGLGWLIDKGLNTAPWGLVVGILIGVAASMYLVVRTASRMSTEAKASTNESVSDKETQSDAPASSQD
ncbi:MAG: AtpZ/AtpI family protein [Asticcacaulis sp.]